LKIEIKYKKCIKADLEYLIWLRNETMNIHLSNSGILIDQENHLNRIIYEFENAKLIYLNDNKIGLLKVIENDKNIEIIQIQIDPKFQGKGIGEKVIKELIENSSRLKKKISLSVLKKNKARNLYEKVGFKIKSENEHSYIMEL
jgi:ribosomal protein S18 acetylase RimI-like enzyme